MKGDINQIKFMTQGIYTLLVFLSKEIILEIGKLGYHKFPKGYYTYTGSALGKGSASLKNRLSRHLRKEKQKFWHIDYLLADENVSIEAIIVAQTNEKKECALNKFIQTFRGATVQVYGFGSSDCKNDCLAHLIFFPDLSRNEVLVNKIIAFLNLEIRNHNIYVI